METVSLQKHVAYSVFFLAPLGGYTIAHLFGLRRNAGIVVARCIGFIVCVLALAMGLSRASAWYRAWPPTGGLMQLLRMEVRPGNDHYLAEQFNESRYYLHDVTYPTQWVGLYYFSYRSTDGRELTGNDAYHA